MAQVSHVPMGRAFPVFGFERSGNGQRSHATFSNSGTTNKILGYIPLVGIFVGLCKLNAVKDTPSNLLGRKISLIVRGAIESLSLGFLLVVPDLLLSPLWEIKRLINPVKAENFRLPLEQLQREMSVFGMD